MKRRTHLRIRKTHRWLGLLTGIQFVMWTLGGLYFSWSDLDEIHGDHQRSEPALFDSKMQLTSPSEVLTQLPTAAHVRSVKLIDILGEPVYQINYVSADLAHGHSSSLTQLASATTGALRNALSKEEAVLMARNSFNEQADVQQIEYLTEDHVGNHHEYRGSPLPAYAVTMQHPTQTTVYVAAERGEVTKFRNNKWRIFDFLWMLHTMDYQGRDNFENLLLRFFSIAGMVTILSGFALYFASKGNGKGRTKRKASTPPKPVLQ